MKPMEYHLFDVIFVIESTASCGVYLNEMKTNYIHPALEYFSSGLEDSNNYGIVLYNTSQCAPSNTCNTYGPFGAQKFLKIVDSLELTGGRSESNANLAEGLATALVCFSDLEKRHEKDAQIHKHCILISNSPPYSMPVSECYDYEGKTVEQLATIFSEKNINLSIISPRKIPILYEIFEKSGGDLGITAKNYSKDPRHLVLLKGFSLKELIHDNKPADSPATQTTQPQQNPMQNVPQAQPQPQQPIQNVQQQANVPQPPQQIMQGNEQMVQIQSQIGMNQPGNIRQMNPNIRANNPMGIGQNAGGAIPNQQFPGQMNNFQQQPQQAQQTPQQQPPQRAAGQRPWLQQNPPAQNRPQFMQNNIMGGNMMQNQSQQNSALLSQLNQPPTMNPNNMTPQQQQNIVRMAMQNPNQMGPNQMANQGQMNQMMGNVQQNVQLPMQNQNPIQQMPQQPNMMQTGQALNQQQQQQQMPQQQQQGNMMQGNPQAVQRERIWRGTLEWNDKHNQQNQMKQVPCEIFASLSKETNEVEIRGDTWPLRLIMQLMPRTVISNVGGQLLRDAKVVIFQFANSEPFESLSKAMANGFAGCVHFTNNQQTQCDVKILILLYMPDKKSFYGFVPNDQAGYVEKLRRVIQASKGNQYGQNPQAAQPGQQPVPNQGQPQQIQQQGIPRQIMMPGMAGNQNVGNMGNMMQGPQGDQNNMMFNQQMQMQGGNQQRMVRPNMMPNNNLRHLLQQQQTQFRPQQMGGQQQNPNQIHGGMDYDMNFQMN